MSAQSPEFKPRYTLFQRDGRYVIERVELIGTFATREAARQHMLDTTEARNERDCADAREIRSDDMLAAMAAELPVGFRDRGDGERMQASLLLGYDAGDDVWELEFCPLDPDRNFTLQDRSLGIVLGRAFERIGLR